MGGVQHSDGQTLLVQSFNKKRLEFTFKDFANLNEHVDDSHLKKLTKLTRQSKAKLLNLTLPKCYKFYDKEYVSRLGGCPNNLGKHVVDYFDKSVRDAWCSDCLLEDSLGKGAYIRKNWCLSIVNHCHVHKVPLSTRCQNCFKDDTRTLFVYDGRRITLNCGWCLSDLATQPQIDGFGVEKSIEHRKNPPAAWRRLIGLERQLLLAIKTGSGLESLRFIVNFGNLLLSSPRGDVSPIECFNTDLFPINRLARNLRLMKRPFRSADPQARRRTLALINSLLCNEPNLFRSPNVKSNRYLMSPISLKEVRDRLGHEKTAKLDGLLMKHSASFI